MRLTHVFAALSLLASSCGAPEGLEDSAPPTDEGDSSLVFRWPRRPPSPPSRGTSSGCTGSTIECQTFAAINQERASNGKPALRWNSNLAKAALDHNNYMTKHNCFSHQCAGERPFSTRITDAGYTWRSVGETIAAGYSTASAVVNGWMDSSGHRAILLGSTQEVGISQRPCPSGCRYTSYWTADFGAPR